MTTSVFGNMTTTGWQTFEANAPQPFPPAQSQTGHPEFQGREPSYYFEEQSYQQTFAAKRVQQMAWNMTHRPAPSWTETDEIDLVNKLHLAWFGELWGDENDWMSKAEDLDLAKIYPTIRPKRKLSPFHLDYQTYAEIKLRLQNTVILINGSPFYVARVKQKQGDFILGVQKDDGQVKKVPYKELKDLRTIPPMYVTTNSTGWLCRFPGRVYQQGVNRNNTHIRTPDGKQVLYNIDSTSLIRAIDRRTDKNWHLSYEGLMEGGDLQSVRLSDDLAVYGKQCTACYKGRALGTIQQGEIVCDDEDDLLQEWIEKSAKSVGLELRAA